MAENSGIAWTTHTFNPWIGCLAVSPACDHCYAKAFVEGRMGRDFSERRRTADANWRKPLSWNRKAEAEGERAKVFTASLADVFDNKAPQEWRDNLWALIRVTRNLDWLLLTKRPQNITKMLPDNWDDGYPNVWLGTTVENQAEADRRIPVLLRVPARVHFLSCEPLLGPVNLRCLDLGNGVTLDALTGFHGATVTMPSGGFARAQEAIAALPTLPPKTAPVDWVIVGGESGGGARPMKPEWARDLRRQCDEAGAAYFFKQTGSVRTDWPGVTGKGDNPDEWPSDLAVQKFPTLEAA